MDKLGTVGAGIAIGLAGLGAAIGLGLIGKAWLESLGRNPEGAKAYFVPAILALALTEAVAIYGLVVAFMALGK
ncbi:MAG: ATP synthase F0 subunit C [candidate division SR1 bacterium]|nr:ATP synthase F0 subunit C [candidate division SR1 bacterium]